MFTWNVEWQRPRKWGRERKRESVRVGEYLSFTLSSPNPGWIQKEIWSKQHLEWRTPHGSPTKEVGTKFSGLCLSFPRHSTRLLDLKWSYVALNCTLTWNANVSISSLTWYATLLSLFIFYFKICRDILPTFLQSNILV